MTGVLGRLDDGNFIETDDEAATKVQKLGDN